MAEKVFKSAGVSTREIDLTGRSAIGPQGVPAGVIGTANAGPAFVPITVGNVRDFVSVFGVTDGEKFGPIAMYEWFRNAKSGVYMRILGVGDGKQKLSADGTHSNNLTAPAGGVKNAGFTVGQQQIQTNANGDGILGDNVWASNSAALTSLDASMLGRTYFLGCHMSESNGSTFFSDSGIQTAHSGDLGAVSITATDGPTNGRYIEFADGYGNQYYAEVATGTAYGSSTATVIGGSTATAAGQAAGLYNSIVAAIAAGLKVTVGKNASGDGAFSVNSDTTFHVYQQRTGEWGNTDIKGNLADVTIAGTSDAGGAGLGKFTGGAGKESAPIVRGVLMAPSGVNLALSGWGASNPLTASTVGTRFAGNGHGAGAPWGHIDHRANGDKSFVMYLNGHISGSTYKSLLTASFDPRSKNYFANVFNTDPTKMEEAGHYLYTHYDINSVQAEVSSSFNQGHGGTVHQVSAGAFLMTGSQSYNAGAATAPNYESFTTRFQHAFSPWIISQTIGGSYHNLFKIHALDAGTAANTKYKVSIANISKSNDLNYKYGTFDLQIRNFYDTDSEPEILEKYLNLSMDPTNERYIARIIGDQNTYFDFDQESEAQKIVVEGLYANNSQYIRVEVNSDVEDGITDSSALPTGFRGHHHLVTSGSSMILPYNSGAINVNGSPSKTSTKLGMYANPYFVTGELTESILRLKEPPVPMRQNVSQGSGSLKRSDSRLYWGVQFEQVDNVDKPNQSVRFNKSIESFTKFFPTFHSSDLNMSVGNNAGTADSNGSVLDSDNFNNNLFNLERIHIHTKSATDIMDPTKWKDAQYRRDGSAGSNNRFLNVDKDFGQASSRKFLKFTLFMQGGFDGTNVFDKEVSKMSNTSALREMLADTLGKTAGPTVSAYKKAIDIMSTKSETDIQILAIPGIREKEITDHAIAETEDRFDAIYIMDITEKDHNNIVLTGSSAQEISVTNTVDEFQGRNLDSSFAAAYFPDVMIPDPTTGEIVQCPPSVGVLGAFSLNDKVSHPWFAPAGFSRGALATTIESYVKLNRENMDAVYEVDINPITAFPSSEGVVIFGQKTLLQAQSALDRVNVRRLLIDVRRKIKAVGNGIIFEPNRDTTLARFSNAVSPILSRIQAQQGIDRYKVIIDTTTTTQADIENNTIRGKIFLQPTRAVEFISLDFVVTNAGAEI